MAESGNCLGHSERASRQNKVNRVRESPVQGPDENRRVLIKRGSVLVETSLKDLEDNYASKPEWKVIEEGGVLIVPMEEFRMINPPKPDRSGNLKFLKKEGKGAGNLIEGYPITETVANLKEQILMNYNEEKEKAEAAGKSEADAEIAAMTFAIKLPEFTAVQRWLDNEAEIKLKKSFEEVMTKLEIPALILRSLSLKAISALRDLGLNFSGNAEIDLLVAFVSGDLLHVVVCEVKRADTYPWQTECSIPNKQAVNKAENQLTKHVEILMSILAGIPPSQIIFHTLACFPDASSLKLKTLFCSSCLETSIVSQDDLTDLSLLKKKAMIPEKPDLATTSSKKRLLTLTSRLLSQLSLLHIGYREVEDKERLAAERHKFNVEFVDGKLMQKDFVVASQQQQKVIASFTSSSTTRHLVLEGSAGTGKTLVALQVANNLVESALENCEFGINEPVLTISAQNRKKNDPIMKYLDTSACERANKVFKGWTDLRREFGVSRFDPDVDNQLLQLTIALAKKWEGRQIVLLVDEISRKVLLSKLGDQSFPDSVRMILILNPRSSVGHPLTLPSSFLHVTLTTPYRSTIAITSLARFMSRCKGLLVPEGDFGSDVEGIKPIFLDVGKDERKMEEALVYCRKYMGDNATTILYDQIPRMMREIVKAQGKDTGGPWDCHEAHEFFGSEADRVVAVIDGFYMMEMITRARIRLAVILATNNVNSNIRKHFQEAASLGLVDIVQLS